MIEKPMWGAYDKPQQRTNGDGLTERTINKLVDGSNAQEQAIEELREKIAECYCDHEWEKRMGVDDGTRIKLLTCRKCNQAIIYDEHIEPEPQAPQPSGHWICNECGRIHDWEPMETHRPMTCKASCLAMGCHGDVEWIPAESEPEDVQADDDMDQYIGCVVWIDRGDSDSDWVYILKDIEDGKALLHDGTICEIKDVKPHPQTLRLLAAESRLEAAEQRIEDAQSWCERAELRGVAIGPREIIYRLTADKEPKERIDALNPKEEA